MKMKYLFVFALLSIIAVQSSGSDLAWSVTTSSISYKGTWGGQVSSTYYVCQFSCSNGVWTRTVKYSSSNPEIPLYSWSEGFAMPPSNGINPFDYNNYPDAMIVESLINDYQFEEMLNKCFKGCIQMSTNDVIDWLNDLCLTVADQENIPLSESAFQNNQNVAEGADPIYLSNGEYGHSTTDVVLPGRGLPIIISRTYGSRREYNSRFGYGWDMNYNMKIRELDVVGEVALLDGKGNRRYYEQDSLDTTRFIRFDDRSDYIISNGGAATYPFELVKKSGGIHYKFDLNGNLAKITDRNGNEITLEYDATLQEINGYSPFFQKEENGGPANRHGLVASEYKLRAVYDSLSRRLDFEYDDDGAGTSGVLTRIVEKLNGNPTGRDWIYEYDASYNNLRFVKGPEVTDPETSQLYRPTTEYLYDEGTSGYPTALKEIYDPINFDNSGDAKKPYLVNYYFNPLTLDDYIYPKIDFQSYGESADADDSIYELSYDTDSQRSIVYDRQKVNSPAIPKSYTVTAFNDSGQTASETVVANASDEYPDKTLRAYSTSYEYNQYNEVKKVILPKRNCIEYIYEDDSSSFLNVDKLTVIQRPECDVLPFNGSSDYVKVLDHEVTDNDYDFATSDFSVALWAKRTTVNSPEYLLYRVDSATGYGWSLKFDSNTNPSSTNHVVLTVDGVDVISSSIIADGDWHYIVASVDRDGSSGIYIDGGPIENYNSTSITTGTAAIADLYMGCSYDGSTYGDYFKGSIDEVMILDRSLDREDCFGLTINSQGLIGYWKMDETSGTSIADTTPRDISESPKNGSVNPIRTIQAMLSGGAVAGEIKVVYDYTQHNGLDYVDTVTDSKGNVISYKYDFEGTYPTNVGNLMEITYPSARVASRNATDGLDYSWESSYAKFEYNNYGQISKMTVLNDLATSTELVTQYDYYPDTASDENEGRPWKVTIDPSGENIVTEFSYDIYGHMNTTTLDPIGQGNSQDLIISEKLFNALDQIVKITDPLSLDTYFEHNKNDKLKRIKRAFTDGDNAPQTQMIEYSYDLLDNLKTVQDSLGYITENFYDGNENVIAVVDAEGAVADYETDIFYDERGLVYKTVDAKGNATTYSYDANGHLELITDAKSQETSYEYDIFGRPVKTVYPDNSTEESGYDSRDVAWSKNRAGDYFYFDYDALGRVIRKIVETASAATTIEIDDDPAPGAIGWAQSSAALGKYGQSYYYAAESGKTCDFQSSGSLTGSYTIYMWWPEDATAESVTVSVTGASDITINQNQNNSQWYELGTYNFNSQVTVTITSGSTGITCADAVRFVPTSHDITDYSYDIAGRLLQVDDNSDATKLYYDGLGRLKNVKDKDNREVSYDYDKLGRRTSLIYPDDTYVTYHYDKLSRLEDIKYDDNPGDANPAVVIAHYDYDALSRRTDLYYNYDGDSTYDDDNDNLDPEDDPIDYTNYDGHMKYDYEDKVETPTQTNNNLGNRLHIVDHDIDNDGTAELKHAYTYDAVGNRQSQVITDSTTVTHNYAYDNIYQLIQDSVTNSVYDYDYDALGNRNDIYYNSSIYEDYSTYDRTGTTDNYLNQYGSVGATSSSRHDYSYDANGNLVGIDTDDDSIDEIVYGYDAENRMTSAVTTTTNAAYTYDHAGRRISKTVGTTTTEYVYSGDQVIAEYVGSNWVRKFIYGSGIDEPICMIVAAGQTGAGTYFYHFDGLGSVVALSKYDSNDGYASIVERYTYDAFGNTTITTTSGYTSPGNPYMFTGRRYDPETELYHYRARMYSPELGRFLQTDPIGYGDGMDIYAYVGNNPINWGDPYGLSKDPLYINDYDPYLLQYSKYLRREYRFLKENIITPPLMALYDYKGTWASFKRNWNYARTNPQGAVLETIFNPAIALHDLGADLYNLDDLNKSADAGMKFSVGATLSAAGALRLKDKFLATTSPLDVVYRKPGQSVPRASNGDYLPHPDSVGSHTQLGWRKGRKVGWYQQGATFDGDGKFLGRYDITDHGRLDHVEPHFHPAASSNGTLKGTGIPAN